MNKAPKPLPQEADMFGSLLGYHLRRLSVTVMADLTKSLSRLGLKPADASILFVIASQPGITQSDVGKVLGILRANMAPLIAGLVNQGLIEREAVDGRSQALRLSIAGHSVCRHAQSATRDHEKRFFGALSGRDRARMLAQVRALWEAHN